MANYENRLTVIGSKLMLWRFGRVIRREMAHAEKQRQIPFQNTAQYPRYFRSIQERPRIRRFSFFTSFLPTAYVRRWSRCFPTLVFNLTFEIDRDIWDESPQEGISEDSGDFTLVNGETACGHFTYESVARYPAWDYDPEPLDNNTIEEAS